MPPKVELTTKSQLERVTVTGADDDTTLGSLLQLSNRYPFVEWGILLNGGTSGFKKGRSRFPGVDWIRGLNQLKRNHPKIKLCGHLCGSLVRDLARGYFSFAHEYPWLLGAFERFQINFHGEQITKNNSALVETLIHYHHQFIFQIEGVNDDSYHAARYSGVNCVPLFDLSHGTGALPAYWPERDLGGLVGFAGGLGPDTLATELPRIIDANGEEDDFWIDMETRVRTADDRSLSLDLVEQSLKICEPFLQE